jgi:hypothetical protein
MNPAFGGMGHVPVKSTAIRSLEDRVAHDLLCVWKVASRRLLHTIGFGMPSGLHPLKA